MKGLKNVKVYIKNVGVVTTNIGIENGKIAYIGDNAENIEPLFETDGVVLPGFIDEHIHGAGGADAMDGTVEALQTICERRNDGIFGDDYDAKPRKYNERAQSG